jgi:hypothetical protein
MIRQPIACQRVDQLDVSTSRSPERSSHPKLAKRAHDHHHHHHHHHHHQVHQLNNHLTVYGSVDQLHDSGWISRPIVGQWVDQSTNQRTAFGLVAQSHGSVCLVGYMRGQRLPQASNARDWVWISRPIGAQCGPHLTIGQRVDQSTNRRTS